MSSEPQLHAARVEHIIQTYLGGTAEQIVDRSPGFSGSFVYAVDVVTPTGTLPCIVKLIPDWPEDHSVTDRVYGARPASFPAAYALLEQAGIRLPKLYLALTPEPALPFYCYVMERLPGEDSQSARAGLDGASQRQLDALLGHQFGAIHTIGRAFDGWADQREPDSPGWREAFFTALDMVLEGACIHPEIVQRRGHLVQTFENYAADWVDPSRFVLSHGDGLQGLVVQTSGGWALSGVVDIEDHRFTDPRFALAVQELGVSLEQAPLHESFWSAYREQTVLEPSYAQLRPLFQLYALLDWLGHVTQPELIATLTHEVLTRCAEAR